MLESPDRTTWTGRRDHALFLLATQTGLRVSELTRLTCGDVHLGTGAHVSCHGKGRKARATPLTSAVVTVLHSWMTERAGVQTIRCSQLDTAHLSAATPSNAGLPNTLEAPH